MTAKDFLQARIAPAEIIGEVGCFPYKEKDGQQHLFKKEWRCLVAISSRGPLVLMGFVGEYKENQDELLCR